MARLLKNGSTVMRALEPIDLFDFAHPDLYRGNAHAILGVDVNAEASAIRRAVARRAMKRKLASGSADDGDGRAETRAVERLETPRTRFLEGLFWYWPTGNGPAAPRDPKAAETYWLNLDDAAGRGQVPGHLSTAARHNLAVLRHQRALASGAAEDWRSAFAAWRRHLDDPGTRAELEARAMKLHDPQLTTRHVWEVVDALPATLCRINATLCMRAAEASDDAKAALHRSLLLSDPFGDGAGEAALVAAIEPLRSELFGDLERSKRRAVEAPREARETLGALGSRTEARLATLARALGDGHRRLTSIQDKAANTILSTQIAYCNDTEDWALGVELLALARRVAATSSVQERIDRNLEIVTANAKSSNWCTTDYWALPKAVLDLLEPARRKCDAGDFDAALAMLVDLGAHRGPRATRHCVAHVLSLRALRHTNDAIAHFNEDEPTLKRLLDYIGAHRDRPGVIAHQLAGPDPTMSSFRLPPCLACQGQSYTSWSRFKFKDIPLWYCSDCSTRHEREIDANKIRLSAAFAEAHAYLTLAARIDPDDNEVDGLLATTERKLDDLHRPPDSPSTVADRLGLGPSRARREGDVRRRLAILLTAAGAVATLIALKGGAAFAAIFTDAIGRGGFALGATLAVLTWVTLVFNEVGKLRDARLIVDDAPHPAIAALVIDDADPEGATS